MPFRALLAQHFSLCEFKLSDICVSLEFGFGRSTVVLIGSLFSWAVGFMGIQFTAAMNSYGETMQIG